MKRCWVKKVDILKKNSNFLNILFYSSIFLVIAELSFSLYLVLNPITKNGSYTVKETVHTEEEFDVIDETDQEKCAETDEIDERVLERIVRSECSPSPPLDPDRNSGLYGNDDESGYSDSSTGRTGSVNVHSYTRRDGTYVHGHTRSYPRR